MRYRLRDIEVIVKRGLIYAVFIAASIAVYFGMRNLSGFFFPDDSDPRNWIVAVLATAVVVLLTQPVRGGSAERARPRCSIATGTITGARWSASRAISIPIWMSCASASGSSRASSRRSSSIGWRCCLPTSGSHDFSSIGDYGFSHQVPRLPRNSSFLARLDAGHTVALDDPIATARFEVEEVELWRDAGIYGLVPCVFEDRAIAVLALGHKDADQPFNSEDLALLTAVAGQAATAIENGRLFRQLNLKAEELDGLREFNENILESLDDGLVVFDAEERIVRWNRALEGFYGVARSEAIGRTLGDVFEATVRRGAARRSPGEPATARRCSACRWWAARRTRRGSWSTRRPCRCRAARISGVGRHDSADREHHRSGPAGGAAADCPRRWRRSACWRPESPTRSTRR